MTPSFKLQTTIIVLLASLLLTACRKASTETLNEVITDGGMVKYAGSFSGTDNQQVSGEAKIYLINNKYQLKLENFRTDNGPDLKVYLSKKDRPSEFISFGAIKSTNGNQVYEITGTPDFTIYRYVLIHCERYNHLYGRAELK